MPRRSRIVSQTGIYHIMLRGNEKKDIFSDEEDKSRMMDTIIVKRKDDGFKIYAFCIMDNHLHMLIKEEKDEVSRIVKRIATSYAYYYNKKHKRIGHVFQDRFKSEAIKDEGQLLEVVRYIHNNPVKANIVKDAVEYLWSSYGYYTGKNLKSKELGEFVGDIAEILSLFSAKRERAVRAFVDFTRERVEEDFIDIDIAESKNKEIKKAVFALLASRKIVPEDLRRDKEVRDAIIRELKFELCIPGRQIAKLLGVNRNIVQRIKEKESFENNHDNV